MQHLLALHVLLDFVELLEATSDLVLVIPRISLTNLFELVLERRVDRCGWLLRRCRILCLVLHWSGRLLNLHTDILLLGGRLSAFCGRDGPGLHLLHRTPYVGRLDR